MIKFIRDLLLGLGLGFIFLGLFLVFSAASAKGVERRPADTHPRAFVVLSVAAVAANIMDAEVTSWKLRSDPYFAEHNPLYGRRPARGAILGWELAGAAAAVLVSREVRRHGHPRLALVPQIVTIGSSAFWVQHNSFWKDKSPRRF